MYPILLLVAKLSIVLYFACLLLLLQGLAFERLRQIFRRADHPATLRPTERLLWRLMRLTGWAAALSVLLILLKLLADLYLEHSG